MAFIARASLNAHHRANSGHVFGRGATVAEALAVAKADLVAHGFEVITEDTEDDGTVTMFVAKPQTHLSHIIEVVAE